MQRCTSSSVVATFALLAALASAAPARKIYAAGSGLDMLSQQETVAEIIALSGATTPHVLYLGTATYDESSAMTTQTKEFIDQGCTVSALPVAISSPGMAAMQEAFGKADIVLVSGGNTLFARDRWVKLGIDRLIKDAESNGTVLCGGSAGGIVWFDGGHSDSMSADSYKNPPGPLLNPAMTPEEMNSWSYIRVPGLSVLPGLFCPHYDITEGNGVLRSDDFTHLMRRHSGEAAVGVDNWAAIRVQGDSYTVISRKGKPGSVLPDGTFTSNHTLGRPGAWRLRIDSQNHGSLVRELVPETGLVDDLFRPAAYIEPYESMLSVARAQNPDDGRPPSWIQRDAVSHSGY